MTKSEIAGKQDEFLMRLFCAATILAGYFAVQALCAFAPHGLRLRLILSSAWLISTTGCLIGRRPLCCSITLPMRRNSLMAALAAVPVAAVPGICLLPSANQEGSTALINAVKGNTYSDTGAADLISLLLERGAKVNAKDKLGNTCTDWTWF